jgi:hypothetical protein
MNDIKTIEELRTYHERLKEVVAVLKRLEERDKESKGQAKEHQRLTKSENHKTKPYTSSLGAVMKRDL